MIDTFLAKVQSVSDAAYDAQGHLRKEASITLLVYDGTSNKELTLTNGEDNYSYVKGDYVLLNAFTAYITCNRPVFALTGNFIYFINIYNSTFCLFNIKIGCLN